MGFFSWNTSDTDRSIANNSQDVREVIQVSMVDDKGNVWKEDSYDGYGEFGGKDYYELLAEMNGLDSDRGLGIDLYFGSGSCKQPILVERRTEEAYKDKVELFNSFGSPSDCEYQGYFYSYEDEHDYYFVQIFKRRKDNPYMTLGVKRIKSYCVYSFEDLEKLYPRIQEYCEDNNARAYIRLNKQNAVDVSLRCIAKMTDNILTNNVEKNRNVWDAVSGKGKGKNWIIDVNDIHLTTNPNIIEEIIKVLDEQPQIVNAPTINRTINGFHIICSGFDVRKLNEINHNFVTKKVPSLDINKDGNTLLFFKNYVYA